MARYVILTAVVPIFSPRLFHQVIVSILNVMKERIHPCETHKTCKMSTQEVEEQLSIATLGNKDRGEDKYGLIINTHF